MPVLSEERFPENTSFIRGTISRKYQFYQRNDFQKIPVLSAELFQKIPVLSEELFQKIPVLSAERFPENSSFIRGTISRKFQFYQRNDFQKIPVLLAKQRDLFKHLKTFITSEGGNNIETSARTAEAVYI
ncbi:hypothetical protein RRG08_050955 [Elysia crispata]|uniref:Uncharacterized protein n=1 Tax=Elysia crispata TaxID=231223 RepID=A0AAE0YR48_9GAST|nr:hypothetical protein RRG08_050955 [Elysia crispata]